MDDLVSICIPTFNNAQTIGEALYSAMAQTYKNIEILVLDNHSDDDTEGLVSKLGSIDSRVRYIRHDQNIGMSANFNACIEQAAGRFIKFVCADDVLAQDCVERMISVMRDHPGVSLVTCARNLVTVDLRLVGVARYARHFVLTDGTTAIRRCLFLGNRIGEPTAVMFRRIDAARGFHSQYSQLVDLEMWFHLLEAGALAFLPQALCSIRVHPNQATSKNLASGAVLEDKRRMFQCLVSRVDNVSLREKLLWDTRMALTACRSLAAGYVISPKEVQEVFFHGVFARLTYPAIASLRPILERIR